MEIQKIKLQLIQKILDTNDPEILSAIDKLLFRSDNQSIKEGSDLLRLLNNQNISHGNKDQDLQDLQQSINDAFNISD